MAGGKVPGSEHTSDTASALRCSPRGHQAVHAVIREIKNSASDHSVCPRLPWPSGKCAAAQQAPAILGSVGCAEKFRLSLAWALHLRNRDVRVYLGKL